MFSDRSLIIMLFLVVNVHDDDVFVNAPDVTCVGVAHDAICVVSSE